MNDPYLTDHYLPLEQASTAILTALREDESSPQGDLYKRLVANGGSSSGRYYPSVNGGEGGRVSPSTSSPSDNTTSQEEAREKKEVAAPTNTLVHSHSIPLPSPIASAMKHAKISSFMGLFAQANLVWVACDGVLFLWRHGSNNGYNANNAGGSMGDRGESDAAAGGGGSCNSWGGVPSLPRQMSEDVCSFNVPSGQCVVGVGVVRPKRGVFKPSVQWCVIVSTPSEVILCALQNDGDSLRLIPTRFILPTDNVPMISIRGTKDGRIFMGGYDGCLYEMNYEHEQYVSMNSPRDIEEAIDNYFDGDGELRLDSKRTGGGVLSGGKRVLSALTFGSLDGDVTDQYRRRKCRKINHSSVAGGISSVVPGIVVKAAVGIFGSSLEAAARKGGPIVSIALDEERMCLYTLGASGIICTYDLLDATKSKKNNLPPRLASVLDSVATAKLYLDSVSRGRMYPPATTQSIALGTITFPGGVISAQAGVGGMEGAREIMKRYDREIRLGNSAGASSKSNPREMSNSAGILHPVSIHLVGGEESKSLTLVAVTGGGLRYYLSSLTSSYMSSAQATQGSFDYATRENDSTLARTRPSKKMTFCHVRAPPPYTSPDGNDRLKIEVAPSTTNMLRLGSGSGIPPGIHNNPTPAGASTEKKGDVVRSYYSKDLFVLALDVDKRNQDEKNNAIVVALPDTATRITASTDNTSTAITVHNGNNTLSSSACGGISETFILPMTGIGGTASPVLSGGTTFDVSSQNNRQSSVVTLFINSETPTDSKLQIGLMPSFTPLRSRPRKINPPGMSSAIAAPNSQGRGVISSALSTISNYLRGQGHGYQVSTVLSSGGMRQSSTYRISRRHGCDARGFSSSSAEILTRLGSRATPPRSTAPKSARLPSWLMKPSAAPMSYQSSLHLTPPGSGSVLVLNAGGLHFFTNSSLLNNLASVLLRASNIAKDDAVRNFFTSYGYAEGCAMCFSLATSSSSNSNLRGKAEQAILTHAHTPSMQLIGTGDGRDPLSAYKFQPSSLYEGLVKFSSRLLRPFWYKVAVVVTEGKPIQSQHSLYSNYYAAVPAKVELLLDDITLNEIRRPLMMLLDIMKKTFNRVVDSIPGASKIDSMDIDLNPGLITTTLQKQSRAAQRGANSTQLHDLTLDELKKVAFQREDRNMHSLYRLWSRSLQLLDVLSCLKHAHSSPALPEVQFGLLHGLTFCQLVTTFEGQQRIEIVLNALFSQSDNNLVSDLSMEGDALADMLSRQCYLYFSAASRLTYLGFKSARDALASAPSHQRAMLSSKAAAYLRAAARHWHDPAAVVGRLSTKNNTVNNWLEIAQSAIDSDSPLALAADELMKLGNAQGLADVCLICAGNFGGVKVPRDERKELGETPVEEMFEWEKGLYQQPPTKQSSDNTNGQSSNNRSIVVSGIQATPSDALKACHGLLFYYISKLLGEGVEVNQGLAVELLGVCASSSDLTFLRSLYDQLLDTNNVDTLLRIDSSTLEKWLKEKNDINLLFKYYSFHGRNTMAATLMQKRAFDTDDKIPLAERIECLTRSANAYSSSLESPAAGEQVSVSDLRNRITHIKEQLDVANIQHRVLTAVKSSASESMNLEPEKMDALSFSLCSISDIYNEYAAPLNLFDICLIIMETCRRNDRSHIATLWRSIICEELLPISTKSRDAFEYLIELKDGSIIQDDITFGESTDDVIQQFDNGNWILRLKARVKELGKNLYGKGADYTFPLDLLLETLEGLRQMQIEASSDRNGASHPWPAQTMIDVGVPYYEILATYDRLRQADHTAPSRFNYFVWICELLELWIQNAQANNDNFSSYSSTNQASSQLVRAISQDKLLHQIDTLKNALEEMNEIESNVYSQLVNVQETLYQQFC